MTLDTIVNAYLILVDLRENPQCPTFEDVSDTRVVFPLNMLIGHLERLIDRYSRTKEGIPRHFMHHDQSMIWCESRRRFVLENGKMLVDTSSIEIR
jgi:hypothetical protein